MNRLAATLDSPAGFVLSEEVGRGGMGVVFRARDMTFDRDVALKVLLGDPASPAARRFTDEAKITARLQHPGIPAVHQTGTLPDGRPFLVMKLIQGRTLSALLKVRGHGSATWLGVFEGICQAVGAAHAAGYIHRDLKPANVMVGAFGEVQVMDWGLAKQVRMADLRLPIAKPDGGEERPGPALNRQSAIANRQSDDTLPVADDSSRDDPDRTNLLAATDDAADSTKAGTVMGTPSYMASEQARGEPADRRTDVFALGAILCELLTGKPPLTGKTNDVIAASAAGNFPDAHTRLDGCGEDPALLALCKRCLSANPDGRPADASEVATAVAAFRGEADARAKRAEVERGQAETRAAETRKRQRALVWAGGLIAGVLLAGVVGTTLGLVWANKKADDERLAKLDAQDKREKAEAAEAAERVAKEAETTAKDAAIRDKRVAENTRLFFTKVLARSSNVNIDGGPTSPVVTIKDAIDSALTLLSKDFKDDPEGEADVRFTLSQIYMSHGEPGRAKEQLDLAQALYRKVHGREAEVKGVLTSFGQAFTTGLGSGDFTALTQVVDALRAEAAKPGDHKELLELNAAMTAGLVQLRLGAVDSAERSFRDATARAEKKYGASHAATVSMRLGVAQCLVLKKRHDEAEALLTALREDCVKGSGEHSMLGMVCDVLLGVVADQKDPTAADDDAPPTKGGKAECVEHYQRALATAKHLKVENIQTLLWAYQGLSLRLMTTDTAKALEFALKAEELGRGPPALPGNAQAYLRLGKMIPLVRLGRYQEAEPVCKQLLADLKAYPELEGSRGVIELGLTRALVFGRKSAEAEPHCLANIARVEKRGSRRQLAFAYSLHIENAIGLGNAEIITTELKRIEELLASASEADRLAVLKDLRQVGRDASAAKKPDLAVSIHTTSHRLFKQYFKTNHNDTAVAAGDLAHALGVVRKDDGREQLYREAMDGTAVAMGVDHEHTRLCANNLVSYYRAKDRKADAVAVLVTLHDQVEKAKGPSADVTRTRGRAAIDLCKSLGRWADAVPVARKLLAANAAARAPDEDDAMNANLHLGQCLLRAGKAEGAIPHLREALEYARKKYANHTYFSANQFWLAEALLATGKPNEAEPLLLEAYPKIRAAAKPDPDATPFAALDVIIRHYTAAGKSDEVKKWSAERDQLAATADEGAVESLPKLLALSKENPSDTLLTLRIAALQAWFGLNADLDTTRERTLLFAKGTKDPAVAERSAKVCGFGATTTKERMQEALTLARRAVELGNDSPLKHYYLMCLGVLEYRDKDYAAADKTLTAAGFTDQVNEHVFLTCSFYRAMAIFRLNKKDTAKELAAAAVKKMRPLPANKARPLAGGYNADDLIVFLAFQEAKELIGFDGPSVEPAPPPKK